MKLAALCCTYNRPILLGQLIECFLRQDYPREQRELVILDDAGQYKNQEGDGWRLISAARRYPTLGAKRNACAELASKDVDGLLVADDDDIYLPHWFTAHSKALAQAEWSRPREVYQLTPGNKLRTRSTKSHHASWAFRRSLFERFGGYGPYNKGEDTELRRRLTAARVSECDPCIFGRPFFIWRLATGSYHLSFMGGKDAYERLAMPVPNETASLEIGWPCDFSALSNDVA